MIQFAEEKFLFLAAELQPLLDLQYNELAPYKDIAMQFNWPAFVIHNEQGTMKVFTARKDSKLIGFVIFFMLPSFHYACKTAEQDLIYIHPDHRGFGLEFLKYCDQQLKSLDVQVVRHHCKAKFDFGPMLERQGYEKMDIVYSKRLDL